MTLYIIIPVYNRRKFTMECLRALGNQTMKGFKVVVVDDGSTDGTAEMIAEEFPYVKVLNGRGNMFWTAAVNMGIKYALADGADYIMTLNNDTIPLPDFLERMVYWARRQPDSVIGPLEIDYLSKQPYYGGEIVDWFWASSKYLINILPKERWNGIHKVSLLPGRGLLIPKAVFDRIGLFDQDRLPHYMADFDFTVGASRSGFSLYCNYDAKLSTFPEDSGNHIIRKSKSLKNYYKHLFNIKGGGNLRNYTVYVLKNCPRILIPFSLFAGYSRRIVGFWLK